MARGTSFRSRRYGKRGKVNYARVTLYATTLIRPSGAFREFGISLGVRNLHSRARLREDGEEKAYADRASASRSTPQHTERGYLGRARLALHLIEREKRRQTRDNALLGSLETREVKDRARARLSKNEGEEAAGSRVRVRTPSRSTGSSYPRHFRTTATAVVARRRSSGSSTERRRRSALGFPRRCDDDDCGV